MAEPKLAPPDSPPPSNAHEDAQPRVPFALRVAAAWSWRLIVVGIVVGCIFWLFTTLPTLFIPLVIALLIVAPLERVVFRLKQLGVPRGLGAIITLLALLGIIAFLLGAASSSFVSQFDQLRVAAVEGFETFMDWLGEGPLGVDQDQIDNVVSQIQSWLTEHAGGLASGALGAAATIGGIIAGAVIGLIAMFFFLRDGRQLWLWTVKLLPDPVEERVDIAGTHAWSTLRRYTQTTVFVAFVDAVGIGMAAWILGVPLAFPIAILVFLFSFIPMFGATLSGAIATLVALVDGGWTTALLMLGAVLLVQQLEGNVLYPWLFGKALSLHPLVVLLTITAGTLTMGLIGAVIAVPIVSFIYAFIRGMSKTYKASEESVPPITSQVPVIAERSRDAVRRARGKISRTSEIRVHTPSSSTSADASVATEAEAEGDTGTEEIRPTTGTIKVRRGSTDGSAASGSAPTNSTPDSAEGDANDGRSDRGSSSS
ncbi:AI-2E family transporter [Demequina sediminicola]|uniref:AI-2E family transporter n=1 Tax=Demequina sediminicola TaxID=1095026 RepID=UPI000782E8AC|nr:AI-2E family transporter [Demequina sediminicola]